MLCRPSSALSVAPLAGAWIEIVCIVMYVGCWGVAPLAGAWIEIYTVVVGAGGPAVAPLAGAWIEIPKAVSECRLN